MLQHFWAHSTGDSTRESDTRRGRPAVKTMFSKLLTDRKEACMFHYQLRSSLPTVRKDCPSEEFRVLFAQLDNEYLSHGFHCSVFETYLERPSIAWKNSVTVDGKWYPATKALNVGWYADGVIFAGENVSPHYKMREKHQMFDEILTELRHWSDLAFIVYHEKCCGERLRAVVRASVTNKQAREVIAEIKKRDNINGLIHFPGKKYQHTDEEFHALLGVPNGKGVAYMLLQHGEVLGYEPFVWEIQIWDVDDKHSWIWYKIKHADGK